MSIENTAVVAPPVPTALVVEPVPLFDFINAPSASVPLAPFPVPVPDAAPPPAAPMPDASIIGAVEEVSVTFPCERMKIIVPLA